MAVPGADTGPAAAAADRRPEIRPVHALPRGAELPRPHYFRWACGIRYKRQQSRHEPAAASRQSPRMPARAAPRLAAAVGDGDAMKGIATPNPLRRYDLPGAALVAAALPTR